MKLLRNNTLALEMGQLTLLLERMPGQKQLDFHNISIEVDKEIFQLFWVLTIWKKGNM